MYNTTVIEFIEIRILLNFKIILQGKHYPKSRLMVLMVQLLAFAQILRECCSSLTRTGFLCGPEL